MVETTRQAARIDCMRYVVYLFFTMSVGGYMGFRTEKRYQDIAFFNIEQKSTPPKKCNLAVVIMVTVAVTVTVTAIGFVGVKVISHLHQPCCIGALDLDFDFNLGG